MADMFLGKVLLKATVMESSIGSYVACRYSIDDLLEMQKSLPVVICAVKQINKHLDIGKSYLISKLEFQLLITIL